MVIVKKCVVNRKLNSNICSVTINLSTIIKVISLRTVRLIHFLITLNNYVSPIWIVLSALHSVLSALISSQKNKPIVLTATKHMS